MDFLFWSFLSSFLIAFDTIAISFLSSVRRSLRAAILAGEPPSACVAATPARTSYRQIKYGDERASAFPFREDGCLKERSTVATTRWQQHKKPSAVSLTGHRKHEFGARARSAGASLVLAERAGRACAKKYKLSQKTNWDTLSVRRDAQVRVSEEVGERVSLIRHGHSMNASSFFFFQHTTQRESRTYSAAKSLPPQPPDGRRQRSAARRCRRGKKFGEQRQRTLPPRENQP